jgi:hypothetical protein
MIAAVPRLIRAVKILARDGRIPRPLRGLAAFGVLPIPGPFDEAVLLTVGLLLWAFYRQSLREAWSQVATRAAQNTSCLAHRPLTHARQTSAEPR